MAMVDVKVPQLSESVSEATLLQWKKKAGDAVAADEIVIEIETDKVVLEVPAPVAGVIKDIVRQSGDTVTADEVMATIDTEAQPAAPEKRSTHTPAVMPAAAKLIDEKGVDTSQLQGSGRGGRMTKGDVLEHFSVNLPKERTRRQYGDRCGQSRSPSRSDGGDPAAIPNTQNGEATQGKSLKNALAATEERTKADIAAPAAPPSALPAVKAPLETDQWNTDRPEQRVPMSRLRARIAERLLESQRTNAILTTFNEVNMQPVIDLRAKYKEKFEKAHGVRLGFMSFFVKAAVYALKKYPIVNASLDGSDIIYHGYFDIGIAVGSPRGLVVPILRDADQLSIAGIEKKIAEFGQKAKDGKLRLEELSGGTFSISNGGVFGSMLSTPIINPPQSAILGVHATKERAVVENGHIVIRPMNYLALSYDHRLIDGREAVLTLVSIKEALEEPARLLLNV